VGLTEHSTATRPPSLRHTSPEQHAPGDASIDGHGCGDDVRSVPEMLPPETVGHSCPSPGAEYRPGSAEGSKMPVGTGAPGRRLAGQLGGPGGWSGLLPRVVVVSLAYSLAAVFASTLQQHEQVVGIYWPAAGIAVGGLLVSPRRTWAAILTVIFGLQIAFHVIVGSDVLILLVWSTANTVGHLLVAWLVLRWGATGLDGVRAVLLFGAAALLGSLPAAVVGAIGSVQSSAELTFGPAALGWLVGDWLGVLTLTPLVLVVTGRVPWPSARTPELWLATASTVVVATMLFTIQDPRYAAQLSYLVLLPLLWAAIRLRTAGVVLGVALTTVIAVTATTFDRGPFAVHALPAGGRSVLLHLFLVGIAATALLLASRTVESETYRDVATDRQHLLAAVSHELRTPLTAIVGFSELLLVRSQTLDQQTREGLAVILRNGTHLTSLIDNLLALSGSQLGRDTPSVGPTNVVEVVRRHVEEREALAGVEVPAPSPDVDALVDPAHLERIVANLLNNACKHGGPPIRVEVEADEEVVVLRVLDHGPGVPAWFVPKLFDPFSQELVGDRRPTSGLGLGLAICWDLATANGGTLRYDHDVAGQVGTSFTLRLPRAVAPAPIRADDGRLT